MVEKHKNAIKPSMYCPRCGHAYGLDIKNCPKDGEFLLEIKKSKSELCGEVVDGRFKVLRELGAGGMGAVYEALQLSVERKVALKTTHMGWNEDALLVERFMREAKLSSQLNHPNIVSIIDFGRTSAGLLYLAMELVAGESLAAILRKKAPLKVEEAIAIAVGILDGLSAAHGQGILHRDLKPANIMISDFYEGKPRVKILDFGIAKLLHDEEQALTQAGQVVGTPRYLAPEALRGAALDERGDLFSVGVILYMMLCGRYPYGSGANPVQFLQLTQPPEPLPEHVPNVLGNLVMNLLEHDAEQRIGSAQLCKENLEVIAERQSWGGLDVQAPVLAEPQDGRFPGKKDEGVGKKASFSWLALIAWLVFFLGFVKSGHWLYNKVVALPKAEQSTTVDSQQMVEEAPAPELVPVPDPAPTPTPAPKVRSKAPATSKVPRNEGKGRQGNALSDSVQDPVKQESKSVVKALEVEEAVGLEEEEKESFIVP